MSQQTCPYNCKNGKVMNRVTRKMETCPHCAELRAKQARGEEVCEDGTYIYDYLKVPERYTGLAFSMDLVIPPKFQQTRLIPESIDEVDIVLKSLINDVTLGEVPNRTYLFNLGECADISAFAFPFLIKAYKAGLKVAPLVTSLDLQRLRVKLERSFDLDYTPITVLEHYGDNYDDYLDADVCIVVLDAGATMRDLNAVRGLIDNRADKGRATLVFTYAYFDRLFALCTHGDELSLRLATLIQVRYQKRENGSSNRGTNSSQQQPTLSFVQEISKRSLDTNIGIAQADF